MLRFLLAFGLKLTFGLMRMIVREVETLTKEPNDQGATVHQVKQNLAFALSVGHRIHIVNKGVAAYSGPPIEIEGNSEISHKVPGMGVAMQRKGQSPINEAGQ